MQNQIATLEENKFVIHLNSRKQRQITNNPLITENPIINYPIFAKRLEAQLRGDSSVIIKEYVYICVYVLKIKK